MKKGQTVGEEESVLIKYFGNHPLMRIIDFLLENRLFDYSKKQIAEGSGIGKVTLFKYFRLLEESGIVKMTRKFGKTKLYKLDETNPIVQLIIKIELNLADRISQKMIEKETKPIESMI